MAEWVEGVDVSKFQGAILQPQWEALYAAGQRVAVIGSAHPSPNAHAEGNLARAEAAGFVLASYAVVWPNLPSASTIQVAKQMCGRFWPKLSFVAIDCETDGITEAQIYGMEQVILAEGLRPIMYTAGWFAQPRPALFANFGHLPLWTANYRSPPNSEAVPLYANWARDKLIGHQWAGTVSLAGVTVDRNNFLKEFVLPQQEDTMPFLTFHCTPPPGKGYKRWFLEGGRKYWLASAEDVTALEAAGVIGPPVTLTAAQVRVFPGRPNPEDW